MLSLQAQVVVAIILAFMLASSAFNWISSCHKEGLETTGSLDTEFQDSEQLVLNSVSSRRDTLIDQVEMKNMGFL